MWKMARIDPGITGPISGKLGTIVGATWNGIPYIRSRPKRRTSKISRKEQANRDKFARAQFWLKPLLDFVRVGFSNYSPTVVGFNAAKSWLMKNALEQTADGIVIDPSKVLLSHGDLPLPSNLRLGEIKDEELPVYWDVNENDYYHKYDQCMLLAYDIENAVVSMKLTGQFRQAGEDSLPIYKMKGRTYHIYVAFSAADRSRVSNSVYLGEVRM
jgi:hypothetical protein